MKHWIVGIGTTTPNQQLEITGNFRLPATTATAGIIFSDGNRYIHNFGVSNKVRIGDANVTVIEGQVDFTFVSDSTKKENFLQTDGEMVLRKLRDFRLTSWNYKGHDPATMRHYGPMAQDFFAAFGRDDMGIVGTDTTLTGSDVTGINMIAIQALEKRTARIEQLQAENAMLKKRLAEIEARDDKIAALKAQNSAFEKRFAQMEMALQKVNTMSSVKLTAVEIVK